jgi:hypothetical protein
MANMDWTRFAGLEDLDPAGMNGNEIALPFNDRGLWLNGGRT